MKIRRTGAYGILRDGSGRVLLARNSDASEFPGRWTLPGGGVEQGEHPDKAVVREFSEETGLTVRISALHSVTADVTRLPGGRLEHTDRIIYDVTTAAGTLTNEQDGTTDLVEWIHPERAAALPLMPFTATLLALPADDPLELADLPPAEARDVPGLPPAVALDVADLPRAAALDVPGLPPAGAREPAGLPPAGAPKSEISEKSGAEGQGAARGPVQRFGAYAVASDADGRILLAKISQGYPGAGHWHLPGGGTDHGETPEQGLARELFEETSQHGRIVGLLGISHRYDPGAVGPEGVPMDWHVIRALFRVVVDLPTEPVVTEAAGGSTEVAGWFTRAEIDRMPLSELARESLSRIDVLPES